MYRCGTCKTLLKEKGDKCVHSERIGNGVIYKDKPPTVADGSFEERGRRLGKVTDEKNAAYGDSFTRSGEVLRILFPTGISPDRYIDALGMVRVIDKLFRIASQPAAFGESPWDDIAGYGIVAGGKEEAK
jgi:hypothetical protein